MKIKYLILFIILLLISFPVLADTKEDQINDLFDTILSLENNRLDQMYPVGSIYTSTTLKTTTEVSNAIGGTWQAYGNGRVLIGSGSNGTKSYTAGTTGGSESHTHTFTPSGVISTYSGNSGGTALERKHLPSGTMVFSPVNAGQWSCGAWGAYPYFNTSDNCWASRPLDFNSNYTDYGYAHSHTINHTHAISMNQVSFSASNMQPYIVVYRYKRTA